MVPHAQVVTGLDICAKRSEVNVLLHALLFVHHDWCLQRDIVSTVLVLRSPRWVIESIGLACSPMYLIYVCGVREVIVAQSAVVVFR